jgi:hypothetical protein
MPFGTRPFRVHVDPAEDGAEIVNGVADRVRAELLRKMGLADLLRPTGGTARREANQAYPQPSVEVNIPHRRRASAT